MDGMNSNKTKRLVNSLQLTVEDNIKTTENH